MQSRLFSISYPGFWVQAALQEAKVRCNVPIRGGDAIENLNAYAGMNLEWLQTYQLLRA